jgi:hypothetical protein
LRHRKSRLRFGAWGEFSTQRPSADGSGVSGTCTNRLAARLDVKPDYGHPARQSYRPTATFKYAASTPPMFINYCNETGRKYSFGERVVVSRRSFWVKARGGLGGNGHVCAPFVTLTLRPLKRAKRIGGMGER